MIGSIRKHQTWLWVLVIAATIGSFAVFGPTNARMGNGLTGLFGERQSEYGKLGGLPIAADDFNGARKEVMLDFYLKNQQWPNPNAPEVTQETYWRLLIIAKEKELGVHVPTEAAAAFARRFVPPSPGASDQFTTQILKPGGLDFADFENFLHHELGLEQLMLAAGVSGKLVTPSEAETMYRLEHRDLDTAIVLFTASNYMASVSVTPGALGQFYSNQLANYKVPEQVKVQYVKFGATNFNAEALASLTNLDRIVESEVEHLGTNLYHGTKTPTESRDAIKHDVILGTSLRLARKAAGTFAQTLDDAQPHSLDSFAKLAETNHLTVKTSAPFDREYGPEDLKVPASFASRAFSLAPDDMYGGPIVGDDGVYVIALVERIPARTPPLKEIETKVTDDFRYASAFQMAQQNAIKFSGTLTNGLAAGKSFTALCAQAGLHSETLPLFSMSTRTLPGDIEDHVTLQILKRVASATPAGKSSPAASARDGAFVLYVERELPVDEAKLKAELPKYMDQMRQQRQMEAFNQWFNAQLRQDPEFYQSVMHAVESPQMKTARQPKS